MWLFFYVFPGIPSVPVIFEIHFSDFKIRRILERKMARDNSSFIN